MQVLTGVEEVDRLFTAILLWAKPKWRQRTENSACGIDLEDGDAKLLDLRFADDLLLFARTKFETIFMLETLMDLFFFFPRSFFRNRLLFRLFYWSVSRQTRHTKGKTPGPMQLFAGVEEVDWKGWVARGFGQDLVPVGMIRFNVVKIWGGFAEKGGSKGVMAACVRVAVQRAVRAAATLC